MSDILELCIVYAFCFGLNLMIEFARTLKLNSYMLQAFFKNFMDYQMLIVSAFTLVLVVFHYQMLQRKKLEVYCRILVGATLKNIVIKYLTDSFLILGIVYLGIIVVMKYWGLDLKSSVYLGCISSVYILISASKVQKYENF